MQFSTVAISFLASVAIATPAMRKSLYTRQEYTPCSDTLYSNADCCSVDVLGVADLDCETVSSTPTNATDFQSICAVNGKEAMCCTLELLEIGVLCEDPTGL